MEWGRGGGRVQRRPAKANDCHLAMAMIIVTCAWHDRNQYLASGFPQAFLLVYLPKGIVRQLRLRRSAKKLFSQFLYLLSFSRCVVINYS